MKKGLLALMILLGGAMLLTLGCNSDSGDAVEKTGALSFYINTVPNDKAAGIADEMNVTFNSLVLYNSNGSDSVTLASADDPVTIDFLDYRSGEGLMDVFQVPVGSYNCIELSIDSVVTVQGANTCPAIDPDLTEPLPGPICLESGLLTVEEDGSYDVLMTSPLYSVSCTKDNGTATVNIDEPSLSLHH